MAIVGIVRITFLSVFLFELLHSQADAKRLHTNYEVATGVTGIKQWDEDRLDITLDRFYMDIRVMDHVQKSFIATNLTRSLRAHAIHKVAYLFMVKDGLHQHALWQQFFRDASKGTYSIYFHQYSQDTADAAAARISWGEFGASFIPRVATGWGQLSGVEYALFWEALRDTANVQLVLLSEGHVPLKSASYIYRYLTRRTDESKICFNEPHPGLSASTLPYSEVLATCVYKDTLQMQALPTTIGGQKTLVTGRVRKHHQWLVLSRDHAIDVIHHGQDAMRQHLRAVVRAPLPLGSDSAVLGASDESFVATALLLASEKAGGAIQDSKRELEDNKVRSECTSFVYWRHCFTGTTLDVKIWAFSEMKGIANAYRRAPSKVEWADPRNSPVKALNDSPRDFGVESAVPNLDYMKRLVAAGFLFARKFGKDPSSGILSQDYSSILPPLWVEFESTPRDLENESHAWPVLDMDNPQANASAHLRVGKKSRFSLF